MQILHCNFKDREPRLKIDARIACTLDSRGDAVTGLRIFVTRIRMLGIPKKPWPQDLRLAVMPKKVLQARSLILVTNKK